MTIPLVEADNIITSEVAPLSRHGLIKFLVPSILG
ncbi:MAG: hypothetical protein ACI9W6_003118, partial [Motiliproteus sp.]